MTKQIAISVAMVCASQETLRKKFIWKRRVWKGGFPHLETKAEIMGGKQGLSS